MTNETATAEALTAARLAFGVSLCRAAAIQYGRVAVECAKRGVITLDELRPILATCKGVLVAHAHEPVTVAWQPATSEEYWYGLEVLPPAYMGAGGFLVGEPADHTLCEVTGEIRPTWTAFIETDRDVFYKADRALTQMEFRQSNRPAKATVAA